VINHGAWYELEIQNLLKNKTGSGYGAFVAMMMNIRIS